MTLSAFIQDHLDAIVTEWETFARPLPAGRTLNAPALRDHGREILLAIAGDMQRRHADQEGARQPQDIVATEEPTACAAAEHGTLRPLAGFDLVQLFAEFHALRASVTASWLREGPAVSGPSSVEELARFNDCLDSALARSVHRCADEVAASRDMFVAVLGHDLRSPLSGIGMSAVLLAKPGLSDEARQQAAARVRRACRDMNHLITDLLEYTQTRLGSGIPIDRRVCDLGPLCGNALEDIRAGHPGQQFMQRLSGDLSVQADAARMRQVLSNLLNNAVQHGHRESPVTLTADGGPDGVVLTVAHAGDPMPSDLLQAVFEPRVQAPDTRAEGHDLTRTSLGLGLFIVREIVLAHAGSITVESSTAQGTAFTIRLPRARD